MRLFIFLRGGGGFPPLTYKREYTQTDLDADRRLCSGQDVLCLPEVPPLYLCTVWLQEVWEYLCASILY